MPEYLDMPDGSRLELGPMLAYQGKEGCESSGCTRMIYPDGTVGPCMGWHCAHCHEPTSSQGHRNCPALDPRAM